MKLFGGCGQQRNLIVAGDDASQHREIEANLRPVAVRRRQQLHLLLRPLQVVCDKLRNEVTIKDNAAPACNAPA